MTRRTANEKHKNMPGRKKKEYKKKKRNTRNATPPQITSRRRRAAPAPPVSPTTHHPHALGAFLPRLYISWPGVQMYVWSRDSTIKPGVSGVKATPFPRVHPSLRVSFRSTYVAQEKSRLIVRRDGLTLFHITSHQVHVYVPENASNRSSSLYRTTKKKCTED